MEVNLPDILSVGSVGTWVRTALLKNVQSAGLPPMLLMKSVDIELTALFFQLPTFSLLSDNCFLVTTSNLSIITSS